MDNFFSLGPEGPWKRRNLADLGVVTQCIAPTRLNDQYLTNVLLKINCKVRTGIFFKLILCYKCHNSGTKIISLCLLVLFPQLGGLNSALSVENARSIPLVSSVPTLIIGMDVSHGSPGRADVPSIAAVNLPFYF